MSRIVAAGSATRGSRPLGVVAVAVAIAAAIAVAAGSAAAITPLERREVRPVVTLEFLMEACTTIGETAYGAIPHFDCESYLDGVVGAHAASEAARGDARRACAPPYMAPRDLYALIDERAIPRGRWSEPAAPLLVELLERSYPCGGEPPLADGEHAFVQCFAEHPLMPCTPVVAIVRGRSIRIEDRSRPPEYPEDRVLADGEMVWHVAARSWIIANDPSDAAATDVGGCGEVETVDFALREYETC